MIFTSQDTSSLADKLEGILLSGMEEYCSKRAATEWASLLAEIYLKDGMIYSIPLVLVRSTDGEVGPVGYPLLRSF